MVKYGIQIYDDTPNLSTACDMLKTLGVSCARIELSWRTNEPQRNVYKWGLRETLINYLKQRNIEPLILLGNASKVLPSWTNLSDTAAYAQYALAAANKFKPKVIELWNEPVNFFGGTPQQLIAFCSAAYNAIKKVQPNTVLLSPWGSQSPSDWGCITQYFKLGLAKITDAYTIHNYISSSAIQKYGSLEKALDWSMSQFQGALKEAKQPLKPLYVTEYGFTGTSTTENTQAMRIKAQLEYYKVHAGSYVQIHLYDFWDDQGLYSITKTQSLTKKPAFNFYKTFLGSG